LESFITEAFIELQHAVAAFLTWKRPTIVHGSTASSKTATKQVCLVAYQALSKVSLK